MNNKYSETFNQRGHPYDKAMQQFPRSRDVEFLRLFDAVDFSEIQSVLDLPSGGGYLSRFLPEQCSLTSVDPSRPFQLSDGVKSVDLEHLVLDAGRFDLVVSLAALHHVDNKCDFLKSVSTALKSGGYFCVGDVAVTSGISSFLDEFAGQYNGTGHSGTYLDTDKPFPGYDPTGDLKVIEHILKPCHWRFNTLADMVSFCRLLFGLQEVSDQQIQEALSQYVGYSCVDGFVLLEWELLYITFKKH